MNPNLQYNSQSMEECHICSILNDNESIRKQSEPIFVARCCIKRCNKRFCLKCILQSFDKEFQESMYKSDTWICYSCQSLCNCILCQGIGSIKKSTKRKNEQKINKNSEIGVPNLGQKSQFFEKNDMAGLPIFMTKILQHKNKIYKLMSESLKKELKQKQKQQQLDQKNRQKQSVNHKNQSVNHKNQSINHKNQPINNKKNLEIKEVKTIPPKLREMINQTKKKYEDDDDMEIQLIQ